MTRERLPHRRYNENEEIDFNGLTVAVSFGFTDDARIGEVFLSTRKVGTAFDTAVRDLAVMISLALQYGVTPTVMERTLTANEAGQAEGLAGQVVAMMKARLAELAKPETQPERETPKTQPERETPETQPETLADKVLDLKARGHSVNQIAAILRTPYAAVLEIVERPA